MWLWCTRIQQHKNQNVFLLDQYAAIEDAAQSLLTLIAARIPSQPEGTAQGQGGRGQPPQNIQPVARTSQPQTVQSDSEVVAILIQLRNERITIKMSFDIQYLKNKKTKYTEISQQWPPHNFAIPQSY